MTYTNTMRAITTRTGRLSLANTALGSFLNRVPKASLAAPSTMTSASKLSPGIRAVSSCCLAGCAKGANAITRRDVTVLRLVVGVDVYLSSVSLFGSDSPGRSCGLS